MNRGNQYISIKNSCMAAVLFFASISSGGTGSLREGMVRFTDNLYRVKVVGTNLDGFDVPDGILWKDGKLFMADEGGHAFRIWKNGNEVETLGDSRDGLMSPEDLVLDQKGNIFFTDDDAGGVWKIDAAGVTSQLAGKEKGLESTEGIALAPSGEILVGDGKQHKIYRVSQNGEVGVYLESGITKPESMVFTENGDLYVADNEARVLYVLSPGKRPERVIYGIDGFSPESIWYSKGTLYITDSDHGKLFSYDNQGGLKLIAMFDGVLRKVCGITTDDSGNIYLSIQTHIDNKIGFVLRIERAAGGHDQKQNSNVWNLVPDDYRILSKVGPSNN